MKYTITLTANQVYTAIKALEHYTIHLGSIDANPEDKADRNELNSGMQDAHDMLDQLDNFGVWRD